MRFPANYRVTFVDGDGRVFDAVQFKRATDDEAIEEAYRLDVQSVGVGFDVWHQGHLVHQYRRCTQSAKLQRHDSIQ